MTSTATRRFFDEEARRLLRFGGRSRVPGGFGWLADDGAVDASRGIHLWITGRMTHCFALGHLLGDPAAPAAPEDTDGFGLAAHGVVALLDGPLHDRTAGAWRSQVTHEGAPVAGRLVSYDHSFVILAAASALLARRAAGSRAGDLRAPVVGRRRRDGRRLPCARDAGRGPLPGREREHAHGGGAPGGVLGHR